MRLIYTLLLYLALPFVLLRLLWRSRITTAYRRHLGERFGRVAPQAGHPLWVHAVSVGEAQAALPLIQALRARHPDLPLFFTTTTPGGRERIRLLYPDWPVAYLPYDLPGAVRRFLNHVQPRLALIMETELWPTLFHACRQHRIPLIVANARLSKRSARRYARLAGLTRATLTQTVIAAQDQATARRFRALGAAAGAVHITGNIKFDAAVIIDAGAQRQARLILGERPLWIAASTHAGEETQVLQAFAAVRRVHPNSLLILVPRHAERGAEVARECRAQNFNALLHSARAACAADTHVFIVDSMGELPLFYSLSAIAFVGGSLVSIGGHNLLEPAALGLPLLSGPALFNFADISRSLCAHNALRIVHNADELADAVTHLLSDAAARRRMGERGRDVVEQNRGAVTRLLQLVDNAFDAS